MAMRSKGRGQADSKGKGAGKTVAKAVAKKAAKKTARKAAASGKVTAQIAPDARVVVHTTASPGGRGIAAVTKAIATSLELRRKGKWAKVEATDVARHLAKTLLEKARPAVLHSAELLGRLGTRLAAMAHTDVHSLTAIALPAMPSMDPRLVLAVINRRVGKIATATASAERDEIAVLARVSDADAWEELPGVSAGARVGVAEDGTSLVTARIEVERIAALRAHPVVRSLKASMPVQTTLAATTRSMRVSAALLPPAIDAGGAGVVIGIIDVGCDFAHRNFRRADGTSRVLALWDQAGAAMPDSPYGYGRLHAQADIDTALQTDNPYAALGYPAWPSPSFQQGVHGTHVMDIAAGGGLGSGVAGVAPLADIVFVDAQVKELRVSGAAGVGSAFGDSVQLVEALKFVFDTAGARPCVINLSLGTNGGPHDGSSLVEQNIDSLLRAAPNRAVVIAASNSQATSVHTMGQIPAGGSVDLGWNVENYGAEVEIWYPGGARLEASLIAPDGTVLATVQPGEKSLLGSEGNPAVFVDSRLLDPNNGDNVLNIGLAPGMPGGAWIIRLHSLSAEATAFHGWIERFDNAQATFADPVASHLLGSIASGKESIVVGSYDAHKATFPLSYFSSSGPTRDGRRKPELSAPGHNVMAARSLSETAVIKMSGTSMAAPAVTGIVALMLAQALKNGTSLDITQIRQRLLAGLDPLPAAGEADGWHAQYGFGRACVQAI